MPVDWQLAWIIAFVGTVVGHVQNSPGFPAYSYWALVFFFLAILGIFVVIASDSTQTYHVAIVGYLGCGLVLATSSVSGMIDRADGATEAASAGYILLTMVTVCFGPSLSHQEKKLGKRKKNQRIRINGFLTRGLGCLDILLRICSVRHSSGIHRLVCPNQGVDIDKPPYHDGIR